MRFPSILLSAVLLGTFPGSAAMLHIDLPGALDIAATTAAYDCGDDIAVQTTYYRAGEHNLATVTFGERTVAMAQVVSASGAKYAGETFVWWTKGKEASLYEIIGQDPPKAFKTCVEVEQ